MIERLGGNLESVEAFKAGVGKTITDVTLDNESLALRFTDGSGICFYDNGQSCCESRYMRTDDNLKDFIGGTFDNAVIKDAPPIPYEYGDHEVQFLEIQTSKGQLMMSSHNEHNGYYGGFSIVVRKA